MSHDSNMIRKIYLLIMLQLVLGSNEDRSLLQGKHIRVLFVEIPPTLSLLRNATGQVIGMSGRSAERFQLIQQYFNFTYSYIVTSPGQVFEDSGNISGWKNYLIRKEVDIAVGPLAMFASRLSVMDYSYAYGFDSYYVLIPSPQVQPNFAAPWKPFSLTVWILVMISLISIVATLSSTTWTLPMNGHGEQGITIFFRNVSKSADYVVQVLMAQGGLCLSERFFIRTVAGVWCVAAFFIINFYNSTLTSYVSVPNRRPLIEDFNEISKSTDIKITVNRGWAIDNILLTANTGILKYLGDMLRQDDSLRCRETAQCLERVQKGSAAFLTFESAAANVVEEGMSRNGMCRFSVVKDTIIPQLVGFSFPKDSLIRRTLDAGTIDMESHGISPKVKKSQKYYTCNLGMKQTPAKTPLGINNLTGAFMLLIFGYSLATISFIAEVILRAKKLF